jgi:hypothetical protein
MTEILPPEHALAVEPGAGEASGSANGDTSSATAVPPGDVNRRRRHRVLFATGAVVATAAVVGGLLLATQDDDGETTTPPTSQPTEPATTAAPTSQPTEPATTAAPSSTATPTTEATSAPATPTAAPVLEDGRHAAYLTAVDIGNRTVEFDVIQFLTGEEANQAYREDNPGWTGDAPNDRYIINENPRLRTLSVAADVEVTLVSTPDGQFVDPYPATFEAVNDIAGAFENVAWANPFWLTVHDDTIVAIDEQFSP